MKPGIFAKTFASGSLQGSLNRVRASALKAIQFNLALVGGASLPDEIPDQLITAIREAVDNSGLEMVAVSGTYNMAHPDPNVRRSGLKALAALIAAAPRLGTRIITLCSGTRDRDDMWRWSPGNSAPAAWADMLASVGAAIKIAEEHDVILAFEPEHNNIVADAVAGRRLLEEIGSSHLKVVIDAVNLIGIGQLDQQARILAEAFELLGEHIVLAHAKDVLDDGSVVPAGTGGLDYPHYISLLRRSGYTGTLVLHGLTPDDVEGCVAFLRRQLEEHVVEAS